MTSSLLFLTQTPFGKGVYAKGANSFLESILFPFRVDIFSEYRQTHFDRVLLESVVIHLKWTYYIFTSMSFLYYTNLSWANSVDRYGYICTENNSQSFNHKQSLAIFFYDKQRWCHIRIRTFRHVRIAITKTYLIILTPLNPTFFIIKLGFTGVYNNFFFILLKNIDCGYSLGPPRRGGSNEYPQSMFWAEI